MRLTTNTFYFIYRMLQPVTSQVMAAHAVFEPSAKVKRKHCWNTGDEDANSNREYVESGI